MILAVSLLLLIFCCISIYNYFTAPLFKKPTEKLFNTPLVSVLIPARNEEINIRHILSDLVIQDYKNFEVVIGNDNSADNTEKIADEFAEKYSFIKKINVPTPPEGWKGKNYVLHEVSKCASGEILLYIDADVRVTPDTISSAVLYLEKYNADLLSVFPRQVMITSGEKLVVPLLNFFLLSLLPLKQVYTSKRTSYSAGIGQFMIFRRKAYEIIGGHESIKNEIAEDLELVRKSKKLKLKVLTMLDHGSISCRMYSGFRNAADGFSKNFFKGSSLPWYIFIPSLIIFSLIFFVPVILIFVNKYFLIPLAIILTTRTLITIMSGQKIYEIIFHPLQMIILLAIGIRSSLSKKNVTWKGRNV